ncbi:ubiquinol-cytochrome-c reductase complex assembly factor 2-like isoform X2 [Mauremys reevesii]|uniref:ubiquinol-cytochrome-c reductase complex assembly factor 2-like isoform X2 n=1 Tax=Mauremys reevesii TaxID=260615 RepID=UPI00193F5133|nr:ubiquinol-cytochrome-c reductase complex assembly factor 2-like isoform X2 [Mauremys reevesii]
MAATRYRRFLKLCEEWPAEATKRGRDLGAFLRQRVAQAFREGESTQAWEEDCMLLDKSAGWLAQGKRSRADDDTSNGRPPPHNYVLWKQCS